MSQGFGREESHRHRHVGCHALLLPRPVTDGELQLVPGVGRGGDREGGVGGAREAGTRNGKAG